MQEQVQHILEKLSAARAARSRALERFNQAQRRLREVEARQRILHERLVVQETVFEQPVADDFASENAVPVPDSALSAQESVTPAAHPAQTAHGEPDNEEETEKREAVRVIRQEQKEDNMMEEEGNVMENTSVADAAAKLPVIRQEAGGAPEPA